MVSAFLWGGPPRQVLDVARSGAVALHVSAALIAELEDVLARPKFADRIKRVGSSVNEVVADYLALATWVSAPDVAPASRDPDDDRVVACALTAEATTIVSGDADLLVLGTFRHESGRSIDIVTATQFLARLATGGLP